MRTSKLSTGPTEGEDRSRLPLRLIAVAAVIATGCLAFLAVGGGPETKTAIVPNPGSTPTLGTPTIEPTSTPSLVPTREFRWDPLASIDSETVADGGGPFDVLGFDRGYVLVDMSNTVRFSADGADWTPVQLPFDRGTVIGARSLATDGKRVVVVGNYTPCGTGAYFSNVMGECRSRPASWVSDDGTTWRATGRWTGFLGPAKRAGSAFEAIWAVPTGGWDASQAFNTGDESDEGFFVGPALWHSDDGLDWTLLRDMPAEAASECDPYWYAERFWAVADAEGRRVAHESSDCDGVNILSESVDGRDYRPFDPIPGPSSWVSDGLAPHGSRPWVFIGSKARGDHLEAIAWTSGDLEDWATTRLPMPPDMFDARSWALSHGDDGYIATGRARAMAQDLERGVTWLSDDGMTWRVADTGTPVWELADGPAGMLGFGPVPVTDEVYRLDVWKLEPRPPR